jgi:hypothetical protein
MTQARADIAKTDKASLLPALLIAGFALAFGAVASYAPPATGGMAVVFAPGTGEKAAYRAILAAGGRFVAPTRLDNVAVAYAQTPDFAERVRAFGGLFTLAARGLCTPLKGTAS